MTTEPAQPGLEATLRRLGELASLQETLAKRFAASRDMSTVGDGCHRTDQP